VLFALALVLAASEPARPAVALLPLRPLGVPADVVAALELTLRNELSQLPEARVVPEKDVTLQLSREPGCIERMACAAAAASRAGARQLILGTASQLGDSFMIDLKLIDARSAQELRRATHPVNGSRDALIEILRESAVELLAPTRFVGGLQIEVPDAPGAAVFIDGKQVGTVPLLQPVEGLTPGQHTLRVVDKGRELSTFVEVRYGRTGKAKVELGPVHVQKSALPEAAVPRVQTAQRKPAWVRPAAVAGIGLALMTAAVAVVYQARASSTASDLNHRESQNLLVPGDVNNYNEVSHDTHLARDYYIAGAILGAFGGALLYWDLR
jgi:PEGA domain